MARPKKTETERQSRRVVVLLTPAEYQRVRESASLVPVGTWARNVMMRAAKATERAA